MGGMNFGLGYIILKSVSRVQQTVISLVSCARNRAWSRRPATMTVVTSSWRVCARAPIPFKRLINIKPSPPGPLFGEPAMRPQKPRPCALPPQFEQVQFNAAGIDIGSEFHFVAVPSDRDEQPLSNSRTP